MKYQTLLIIFITANFSVFCQTIVHIPNYKFTDSINSIMITGKYLNFHNGYATWLKLIDSSKSYFTEEYDETNKKFNRKKGKFEILDNNLFLKSSEEISEKYILVQFANYYYLIPVSEKINFIKKFNKLKKDNKSADSRTAVEIISNELRSDFFLRQEAH